MKIYPAIDLIGGKVVRLSQGRFESQTTYHDDPLAVASDFGQKGAKLLHVVDLDGAKSGQTQQTPLLEELARKSGLKLQVGGGVRSAADVERLLSAGVERVVLGSLAVKNTELTLALFREFGGARLTLGLDVLLDSTGEARVASEGWRELSSLTALELVDRYRDVGLEQVLCTDIGRDGMMQGPHVELYQKLQTARPELCWLASGGVSSLADLQQLKTHGIGGAIIGKALYEGKIRLEEALQC